MAKSWEDAIRDLTNIPLEDYAADASQEAELMQVAEMIGCRIEFDRGAALRPKCVRGFCTPPCGRR
jgi:hypothetical protein